MHVPKELPVSYKSIGVFHDHEQSMWLPETEPNSDVIFTIFGSTAFSRLGRKCLHVRKGPWRTIISVRNAEGVLGGLTTAMVRKLSENMEVVCSCQAFG